MSLIQLIYRKFNKNFHSIENVFSALEPFLRVQKIELPYLSQGLINRIKNILFFNKLSADLLHITGHDHYLLLGFNKKPTILTIHDIESLNRKKGLKKWLFKKIWFDYPIKNATYVTTISEFSKNEILRLGNYKTSVIVIHNPLTLPISLTPNKFNTTYPSILHIGTKQNKNLSRLIYSLKGITCKLVIIGKLTDENSVLLEENNIDYCFKTNLSNKEIIQEYYTCDIVSFVSTYEGFGLPIIEAQAAGRVVITSNVASMPEVAGDGAYFVNPYDTNEIRKGILELINNDNLREVLIQKGLENVKRFEPQKIAKQYINLYENII